MSESFNMRVRYEQVWAGRYFVKMIVPAVEAIQITMNSERIAPFRVLDSKDQIVTFQFGPAIIEYFVTVGDAMEAALRWSDERGEESGWICNAFGNRIQSFGGNDFE